MLDVESHGEIVELRINRPPANALNHDLLEALLSAGDTAVRDGAKALMLSGQQGMFCAGIDVPELLDQDHASMLRFWGLLFATAKSLAACPVPVVAALTGHSPAGGTVLATHCDYRIGAEGGFKMGFNEVQVGLPLPSTFMRVFADLVGTRQARLLGSEGRMLLLDEALEVGLIDELVPADRVVERSLEYLDGLLRLPPLAMNRTRLIGKAHVLEALEDEHAIELATDAWFSDETQTAMRALAESLKKN